jgi:hypothetical protein
MGDRRKKSFENECLGEWEWMAEERHERHEIFKEGERGSALDREEE